MVRTNCVRAGDSGAQEKAPTAATVEALERCQCRIEDNDDEFTKSFRLMMQCRELVQEVKALWADCDHEGLHILATWEISYARKIIAEADQIARECYRGDIIRDFQKLFGVPYEAFWADLKNLKHFFDGGA